MKKKRYKEDLESLQIELVKLQRHFIGCGDKILVLLEGRDAAGKDGVIKRIVEHLSPRETRVVADRGEGIAEDARRASGRRPSVSFRICGMAAMLGVAWFATSVAVLMYGAAGTGLDWTRHYVSEFVHWPRGWLLPLAILGHAAGNLALALGLHHALRRGPLRASASALFLLAAAGFAATALFAVEAPGAARSIAGAIHRASASASFGLELAALVLYSAAFASEVQWRGAARVSLALLALAGAALAMLFSAIVLGWRPGLAERAALAAFMAWEFWAGAQLTRLPFRVQARGAAPG